MRVRSAGPAPGSTSNAAGVPHGGPFASVLANEDRGAAARRVGPRDADDDARLRRVPEEAVRRGRRAAAAEDEVHRAAARVDDTDVARDGARPERFASGVDAPQRVRALVVMLVPADDEVDAVPLEERQERFADAAVAAVEVVGRGDGRLVHADDHPVDRGIGARGGERCIEPADLRAVAEAVHVGVAAVLEADVVSTQGNDPNRARGEGVPEAAMLGRAAVIGDCEARLEGAEAVRPVAALVLVVARRGHPRPVACRARVVREEV
jgi:hypothetical protein